MYCAGPGKVCRNRPSAGAWLTRPSQNGSVRNAGGRSPAGVSRRAIGRALGYELMPVNEAFHQAGFGPRGDLWEAINGSYMLTRLKAPGSLDSRWLTEDVPYGLGAWVSVARQYGVATPVMESLVNLATPVMGFDAWETGRGVEELGIAGLDKNELAGYLGRD